MITVVKPMSYGCTKSVLQYMEANKRLQLSLKSPTLLTADKSTPLHLNYLRLNEASVMINYTEYKIRVVRKYKTEEIPEELKYLHNRANEVYNMYTYKEGYPFDINIFGSPDWSTEDVVMPGDVKIEAIEEERYQEGRVLETRIQMENEKALRRIESVAGFLDEEGVPLKKRQKLDVPPSPSEDLRSSSSSEICLSIGNEIKEKMLYSKTLVSAKKYLFTKLFGGRTIIKTDILRIFFGGGILRLPENLKIRASMIAISHNAKTILNAIEPVLDLTSLSAIHTVEIYGPRISGNPEDYDHPLIEKASKIFLFDFARIVHWLPTLLQLKNRVVELRAENFPAESFEWFARHWIVTKQNVGACFRYISTGHQGFYEKLQVLMNLPNAVVGKYNNIRCRAFPDVIYVPITPKSVLIGYGTERAEYGTLEVNIKVVSIDELRTHNFFSLF